MSKLFWILVLIILAAVPAGCKAGGEIKTYTDPSQPVDISTEGEFIIALVSNPTTGYTWMESYDETMLKMVEKTYKQGETAKGVVGAGGTEYFRFKALKSGETRITLNYRRPWESRILPDDKSAVFTVRVK